MSITVFFKKAYYYFAYVYLYLLYFIRDYLRRGAGREPKKVLRFADEDEQYSTPLKSRFLETFCIDVPNTANENVAPLFYDMDSYKKYMMEENTELERLWKSRILLENTPRGNVIMYYDAFKLGFSYYCDQKSVSYEILNAVAMKYVTLFRCRHFFIDESVVPREHTSPFIKTHFEEKEYEKGMKKKRVVKGKPVNVKNVATNRFVYLGKINQYSWLQTPPKKRRVLASFKSPMLDSIQLDSNVQRESLSYSRFKSLILPKE